MKYTSTNTYYLILFDPNLNKINSTNRFSTEPQSITYNYKTNFVVLTYNNEIQIWNMTNGTQVLHNITTFVEQIAGSIIC